MKKILSLKAYPAMGKTKKIWLVMKTTLILLFAGVFQVSASVYSQQAKFSMKLERVSVMKVVKEIKKSSDFDFIYDYDLVSKLKKVSINVREANVEEILKECLEDSELEYRIVDKVIMIVPSKVKSNSTNDQALDTFNITGIVVDEKGQPLPGVSVYFKETPEIGTATDMEGKYRITKVLDKQETLVYSFLGFEHQEVAILNKTNIDIILRESAISLEAVQVFANGFTTISSERATASYSVIESEDLENEPVTNVANILEGAVPGVQIDQDANSDEVSITIRGTSTLEGNAKPLIVVDGFPVESDLASLNPNDIESVTILKDAAASSIWGARAANGVVVLVTKKVKGEKGVNVNFGAYLRSSSQMDLDYMARADSRSTLEYEMWFVDTYGLPNRFIRDPNAPSNIDGYSKGMNAYYDYAINGNMTEAEWNAYKAELEANDINKDIEKYMLQNPFSQEYSLSVNGVGDKGSYIFSARYNSKERSYVGTWDKDLILNLRANYEVTKWLDFDVSTMFENSNSSLNYAYYSSQFGATGDPESIYSTILGMSPYETFFTGTNYTSVVKDWNLTQLDVYSQIPDLPYADWTYNPYREQVATDHDKQEWNVRLQTGLTFKLFEGLSYKASFQFERFHKINSILHGEDSYYTRDLINSNTGYSTTGTITEYVPKGDIYKKEDLEFRTYNVRNQVNYDTGLFNDDLEVNVVLGSETIWQEETGYKSVYYGYDKDQRTHEAPPYGYGSNDFFWYLTQNNDTGSLPGNQVYGINSPRYLSFYGNGSFTWDKKYTLSASARTDASNTIVEDNKYRYSPFWSVGANWNIKAEDFLKELDALSLLRLRLTYGVNGNAVESEMLPVIGYSSSPFFTTGEHLAYVNSYGNPTLRWEKTNTFNFAVDFSAFERKLYGSLEYYSKQGKDLLAYQALSSSLGVTRERFNSAELSNKGVELTLNTDINIAKDLKWQSGFNYSYNKSMVENLKTQTLSPGDLLSKAFVEGKPAYPVYAYVYTGESNEDGVGLIEGEENGLTYTMDDRVMYRGGGGEKGEEILRYMGTRVAPTVLGWTNTFKYKGISLRATITGKFGHVFTKRGFGYNVGTEPQYVHESVEDVLAGGNDELPGLPTTYVHNYYIYSRYVNNLHTLVEDADHIRLRSVYLSYDLPNNMIEKVGLKNAKVFTEAKNLGLIWTANEDGIDPEYIRGFEQRLPKVYTFGINIGF